MHKLLMAIVGIVLLVAAAVGADAAGTAPPAIATVHLKIEGMTCAMCAATITKKLQSLCQDVFIDHKTGDGRCTFATGKTNRDAVVKAVNDAGYKVIAWTDPSRGARTSR